MTTVKISGATASAAEREVYTSGTVGATLRFEFDGAWDGLAKTAVFRFGSVTYDVPESEWTDGECVIPHECLAASGDELMCGVYGVSQDGETVIPTVWVRLGYVQSGADPSGDESTAPTLPVWAALKNAIGDLGDLDTTAKNTLVAAINEVARSGGGGTKYQIGSGLILDVKTNTLAVDTTDAVERDNTKPITSAGVYLEIGNINALLETI